LAHSQRERKALGAGECACDRRLIMVEAVKSLFLILSALFPIVDPLGGSPIFLSMTRDYSPAVRKELSWRIAMNSFFLLVGSYFIGTYILRFFEFRFRLCRSAADSS
jgi:small neutral amino acid transporter SnatA (MarC family)